MVVVVSLLLSSRPALPLRRPTSTLLLSLLPLPPFHPRHQAVSRTLNYALSDYAIAQAAKKLGHMNDYQALMNRSEVAYKGVCATEAGRFRNAAVAGRRLTPPFLPCSSL